MQSSFAVMRRSYSSVYFADKRKNSYTRNGNVRDFRIQQIQQSNLHHKKKRQQNLHHKTIQQRNLTAETTRQDDNRNNKTKREQEQQEKGDRRDGNLLQAIPKDTEQLLSESRSYP